jgi:uncharacterized protein YndB with AHSA1/START domain
MKNKIEKSIELPAPVSQVWRAVTDSEQFGEWFGVKLANSFIAGQKTQGQITHPGLEHVKFEASVLKIDPEKHFSFHWHPYAIDASIDYTKETPTLVEFKFDKTMAGTKLTIVETGFDKIPEHRQEEAYNMHEDGWQQQLKNIENYIAKKKKH